MQEAEIFRALSNVNRLQILEWLKDPCAHFPPQSYGDLVDDGVCGQFIAEKLGLTPSTLSEHMRVLVSVGLVEPKRIRQWTFYKRDEQAMAAAARLAQQVLTGRDDDEAAAGGGASRHAPPRASAA